LLLPRCALLFYNQVGGSQGGALHDLMIGLAFELLQEVDGRLQRFSSTLRLRDSVVEVAHFVDDGVSLRTKLLTGGVDAHVSEVDAEADPELLREWLGHAGVTDEAETQRA